MIVIVNKNIKFIFKSSTRSADFFRFKEKYLRVYALAFSVVDVMLPITVKLAVILRSELVDTQVSHI